MKQTSVKNKVAKVLSVISMVFLSLCVCVLFYTTISYSQKGLVNFFNYSFHVIQTQSMEPEIKVGDLVVVKQVSYDEIQIGDDILFKCEDTTLPVYGKYIVHRVVEFTETPGVYITKGVNNPNVDNVPSRAEGKVVRVSSAWGKVFVFFTGWRSAIFIIAIFGIIILTLFEAVSVVKNASLLRQEKDKEKVNNDEKLKEKLKIELMEELKQESKEKDVKSLKEIDDKKNKVDTHAKQKTSNVLKKKDIIKNEKRSDG